MLAEAYETVRGGSEQRLAHLLALIEKHDQHYAQRYGLVFEALAEAKGIGYPVGIRLDSHEPGWPVVYIELPTGQVSWHMPQHPIAWDGHDTEEKYRRCRAFTETR